MATPRSGLLLYSGTARDRVLDGYSRAVAWMAADRRARAALSKQQRSDWQRIALLGARGEHLEELGATYGLLRWVAGPIRRSPALTEERYSDAVLALEAAARRGSPLTDREISALRRGRPPLAPLARAHAVDALALAARKEVG